LVIVTVMLVEQVRTSGAHWKGFTVTVKLQFVLLPQASLAVQVTVVVPSGKVEPLGGVQVTVTGGQVLVAELVKKTTAEFEHMAAVRVILLEQVRRIEPGLGPLVPSPMVPG
jgi:hypothetical protein